MFPRLHGSFALERQSCFSTQRLGLRWPRRPHVTIIGPPTIFLNWFRGWLIGLLRNRLRRIEGSVVHLGTEALFNLLLNRLEAIHEFFSMLLGILL